VHKPHLHHQPIFFEKNVKNRSTFIPSNTGNPYFVGFFKDFLQMIIFQKIFTELVFQTPRARVAIKKPLESRIPIPEDSQKCREISSLCPEDAEYPPDA
jgi:hypothetical protein